MLSEMNVFESSDTCILILKLQGRDLGGAVVTHSPLTSEVCCSKPGPYVEKLVVAYRWSAVYLTEP